MKRPKNRIWPSCSRSNCSKRSRQRAGAAMGKSPSSISTRPRASHQESTGTLCPAYLRAGAAAPPDPRMALKNSEFDGSSTITSPFLAKLAL